MATNDWLDICRQLVHRLDRDREMCAMVAADHHRAPLLALLAFNLEIATIPELVSEPTLGEIRLQWWRDTIADIYDGAPVDHPVAQGLAFGVETQGLNRSLFDDYLDARSFDLYPDPPASTDALERYVDRTAGNLNELMAQVLGSSYLNPETRPAVRDAGMAWAMAGLLDAVPFHARRGRSYLPADLDEADRKKAVANSARQYIGRARALKKSLPGVLLPVMLPTFLAEKRLNNPGRPRKGARYLMSFYLKVIRKSY